MQCRACMEVNCEGVVDMCYVVSADGKTLYDFFNECTQLHATTIDNLPKILCINCTDNLQAAYHFKQQARQSDEEFKKIAALQKVEAKFIYSSTNSNQVLKDFVPYNNDDLSESENADEKSAKFSIAAEEKVDIIVDDVKVEDTCDNANENIVVYEYSEASSQDEEGDGDDMISCKGTLICDICTLEFTTKQQLKDHIFASHKDEVICTECPKIFELPGERRLHYKLVHLIDSPIYCPWCKVTRTLQRAELAEHVQITHNSAYLKYFPHERYRGESLDDTFECEKCQQSFDTVYKLADHIHEHIYTNNCPICSMSFKTESAYKSHVKQVHYNSISSMKAMLFGTEDSNYNHQSKSDMSTMQNEGDEEEMNKTIQCSLCQRQFKIERSLKLHMRIKHKVLATDEEENIQQVDTNNLENVTIGTVTENEFVECRYCHKEILSSKIASHEGHHAYRLKKKGKYICSYCPREFPYETAVKLHERNIHLREKSERKDCPVCHKKVDPYYLKKHLENVHTSERRFVCDICSDGFKTYVQLVGHKRLHSDRKIPCSMCPKKFARPYDLKVHMRFHTGESPFACHLCDQRFRMRAHLTYHLQQHAGIKRKCNDCGKEFNSLRQLKIHSYRHTGMPYRCTVCSYGCALRDVFRKHLLRVHNMTMTDAEYCAMYKANTGRNPVVRSLEELQAEALLMKENDETN